MSQTASTVVSVRRWRTEIFVSWFAATVGVAIGWLAVLTISFAACVTLAAAALTGTLAISKHYGEFYYGDSAWTDRLDVNPLHETAYYGGIALLVFTVPTAVFLGVGQPLFPRSPA
jgi:hypothetical protein